MKKNLLSAIFVLLVLFSNAQCDIAGGSTTQVGSAVINVNNTTTYTFNLTFNLANNDGNKYFNIDMWLMGQYPASLTNGAAKPTCAELATSLANISVNNNISSPQQPTILTSFDGASCTPAVVVETAADGLLIHKQYNPGGIVPVGYDQYTISNIKVTVATGSSASVKFFLWSSQAQSQSVAHCSIGNITLQPTGGLLPVNLSSFLVGRTGADVSLNWKTEIEMNVVNFEVQRSYDNTSFKTIATVAATANGSSTKSYTYVDNSNTSQSLSFYKLKIVKQGEISYSDIKTVKGLAGKTGFVIFPNPSVGNAKITISDVSEPTRIQLLDNSGRLVKTLMLNNTHTVELNGLQKGAYMVRIIGSVSGNTEIRKLTVIK